MMRRWAAIVVISVSFLLSSCHTAPCSVDFTAVPIADRGGADSAGILSGKVTAAPRKSRIVLYAHSGDRWWVQPQAEHPFTAISKDGSWTSPTHLGMEYAALLVAPGYKPLDVRPDLPPVGADVLGLRRVSGTPSPRRTYTLSFSGYDWDVRAVSSPNGGGTHQYRPQNVWLDDRGSLHLAVRREGSDWSCAEVRTLRTLGYGTYLFHIRDIGHLEPATMLSLNTWQDERDGDSHHEIDVHVSRWGVPNSKNGEYVTQPFYIPSNVYRFEIPSGPVTMSFHWSPGSVDFRTDRDASNDKASISAWRFTTNVPSPGIEKAYITLCVFPYAPVPEQKETEVIIDQFQFLP
ncbi:hypothetical protein SAMN05421819_2728 [Bryocella elongata]|uniref:Carboxypeptidase regulatory-like domain-containing protein n=1 Tax=Bryocella elongata TaxID=863522 RepID=A0A1H5ZNQ6_9BACT|nr:hypothetical protein [Bryocella elongata]SEG37026.1 hypothetical protein SAMN05421819_2728 [Bryocella elongata]